MPVYNSKTSSTGDTSDKRQRAWLSPGCHGMLWYLRDRTQTPTGEWRVWLPWSQHPCQKGKRTTGRISSFLSDLLIGAPGFGNLICACVLEEERSLPIGRGHCAGCTSHANTAGKRIGATCVKPFKGKHRIWFVCGFLQGNKLSAQDDTTVCKWGCTHQQVPTKWKQLH